MENAFVMRKLQRLANFGHHGQRLRGGKPARSHRLAQVHAIDKFHEQVENPPAWPKS